MDDRISALSAQIAELSKKIETVSSGSGGSNWVGELGVANSLFTLMPVGLLDSNYTPKIKLVTRMFQTSANMVNPTNRDCIVVLSIPGRSTSSPGKIISSSHGEVLLSEYAMSGSFGLETGWRGYAQLSKGAHLSYSSSGGILNIAYILVEN
ncbi:TPA: hypothetical protein ACH6AG_000171 [Campylobacter jejuni]